jgi:predicted DNA binding CopG/RHH family protein
MVKEIKYSKLINLRIPKNIYELMKKVCDSRGENYSSFIRRAILRELSFYKDLIPEEQKKFLEVK